jgi:hypothetical protein
MQRMGINNEIKYWYKKKQMLNRQLHNSHLKNSKKWGKVWEIIDQNISHKLETKMKIKYQIINKKIKKLKEGNNNKKILVIYEKDFLKERKT